VRAAHCRREAPSDQILDLKQRISAAVIGKDAVVEQLLIQGRLASSSGRRVQPNTGTLSSNALSLVLTQRQNDAKK
jgi:hypothetical protein